MPRAAGPVPASFDTDLETARELDDKGFLVTTTEDLFTLGADRLACGG